MEFRMFKWQAIRARVAMNAPGAWSWNQRISEFCLILNFKLVIYTKFCLEENQAFKKTYLKNAVFLYLFLTLM